MLKALTDMTTPAGVFAAFNSLLTEEVVKLINGSFLFELSGKNADCWLLDLWNTTTLVSFKFTSSKSSCSPTYKITVHRNSVSLYRTRRNLLFEGFKFRE